MSLQRRQEELTSGRGPAGGRSVREPACLWEGQGYESHMLLRRRAIRKMETGCGFQQRRDAVHFLGLLELMTTHWWPKTTEMYCLTVLEARHLRPRWQPAMLSLNAEGEGLSCLSLVSACGPQPLVGLGLAMDRSSLCLHLYTAFSLHGSVCLCPNVLLLVGT